MEAEQRIDVGPVLVTCARRMPVWSILSVCRRIILLIPANRWFNDHPVSAAGPDGISIFDAVDKQLGLKLEPQKIEMAVIVVDKVDQKPTGNLPGVGKVLTADADAPPEFEAAVIKPSAPDSPQQGVGFRYTNGGRVDGTGALKDYVAIALEIPPNLANDLLVGMPKSATARYDIVAKVPSSGAGAATRVNGRETAPPISVALQMLRRLLEDQFELKFHKEDQQATVYGLTLPKGTAKLKKAEDTDRAGCKPDPGAVPVISGTTTPMIAFTCQNTPIAELAKNVQQWANGYIDHPVVDLSGVEGGWNFSLYWTPRGALQNQPRPAADAPAGGGVVAMDPAGLTVFEALEKQLGMKLEVQKHTISVTVVDHINEQPKQ